MNVPIHEWGRRLSDALRAALDSGDLAAARSLALEGDGQARSLAKEYMLMVRGLGITIGVLLPLLRESAARVEQASAAPASADAGALVRRFRLDLAALVRPAGEAVAVEDAAPGLDEEIARTLRALADVETRFERAQVSLADEVVQAIDAGDCMRARALVDAKEQGGYLPLHDRLVRFMAECFGWVLQRAGAGELLRLHLATAQGQRAGFERWEQMPAAQFAWTSAFLLKQHMGEVTVREDAERFTIEQTPCGSGGRLQLLGAYSGPQALPFVESPGPLTFGQPRLAVYCSHCPIWNGTATLRWYGRAHWVFENASRPDGACTLHIYKRRDGTPPEYAARLSTERQEG